MSETCYLCNQFFNDSTTIRHGEHIIQNSVGGSLISNDILCEECGNKLGDNVDKQFALALSPLTVLLQPPRDRGDHSQAEVQLVTNIENCTPLENVQFTLKNDFSVVPKRPIFLKNDSNKTVTVLAATMNQAKAYSQSPAVSSALDCGYTLALCDNAAIYAERLCLTASPNSIHILRGILKIAIGYAIHHGVARENISHLMEKDNLINSESLLLSTVYPYYPTDDAERLFETDKHTHEDWYPTHHLYLFSQGVNLYCYVELFGTIQKYVHLSNSYHGPSITEKFVQKAEKWEFDEDIFTARSPKDLDILARENGVSMANKKWEDIQSEILHKARCRTYSLCPENTVEKVKNLIHLLVEFSILKTNVNIDVVQRLREKGNKAETQLGLELLDKLRENPMIIMKLIHHTFEDFRMGDLESSRPEKARQVPQEDLEKYAAYKFYDLLLAKGRESVLQYELL